MNDKHESNRHHWNQSADWWEKLRDEDGHWRRCPVEPDLGLDAGSLELIRETVGNLSGKDACAIGSGDNYAAFALAGLQANVTSIDISERQLEEAAGRAQQLDLSISFVQADAANLESIQDETFDLVCSTNGFFVWIANLQAVFNEVYRVLRPGGYYVFYDIHPSMRP